MFYTAIVTDVVVQPHGSSTVINTNDNDNDDNDDNADDDRTA